MKRFLPVFIILLSVSSVYSAEQNIDVQSIFTQNKTTNIIQTQAASSEENLCETAVQTLNAEQVCFNKDNTPAKVLNESCQKTDLIAPANPSSSTETQELNLDNINTSGNTNKEVKSEVNTAKTQAMPEENKRTKDLRNVQGTEKQALNPKDLYAQALALYSDNSTDAALETFKLIPEYARTSTAWLLMGNILADMKKRDEAIFMYRRAIAVDKDNYKAYYNLGNMYLEDDIFYTAIDCYKDAIKAKMTFPYAYYNLGIAYVKTGNLKKAKSAFLNAIEYKKDVADFHYNLAYVYKLMNKPKLAQTYLDNYNKLMGY